ncbi:MAG: succinyldiaminopimelate transaminase [Pseudomonadota bacterium]|jgi:N-succinyldiaminopimelate aminotransferase
MNPDLGRLVAYPFERLARLKAPLKAPSGLRHIALSIGEPKHAPPGFVLQALRDGMDELGSYPATKGLDETRAACARWLERRFALRPDSVDAGRMVLPVNGTREALFAFVQAVVDRGLDRPAVLMPNPCYQIYEGAALLAGAEPVYLDTTEANGYLPDLDAVDESTWRRCQVLFLCSPGNPVGSVLSRDYLRQALELAARYDFMIAADECYAELFDDESDPPTSLLAVAQAMGNDSFRHCMVFHSLSKRSSVPGLRSGFVAGCPETMAKFLLYRTYHGCAMPIPTQRASILAWEDDAHVRANRALYREKYDRVVPLLSEVLDVERPAGGFYLWQKVPGDDVAFTAGLFETQNVTVVPGTFLARDNAGANPGRGRIRISLVATVDECVEAARRIRAFTLSL